MKAEYVPFVRRTEASLSVGASSDPTLRKPGNAGGGKEPSFKSMWEVVKEGRLGNLETPPSVRKLQTALHAKAKAEPGAGRATRRDRQTLSEPSYSVTSCEVLCRCSVQSGSQ